MRPLMTRDIKLLKGKYLLLTNCVFLFIFLDHIGGINSFVKVFNLVSYLEPVLVPKVASIKPLKDLIVQH